MNKSYIILIISAIFIFSACQRELNFGCLRPEGNVETRTMDYDDFTDITFTFPSIVEITQGTEHEVIIEATSNVIDRIESDSRKSGNDLDFEINGCSNFDDNDVRIFITLPSLDNLKIEGATMITSTNTLTIEDDLQVSIEGAGEIDLDIEGADVLSTQIEGAGDIRITGDCNELKVQIDGAGVVDAQNLDAQDADIQIKGAGDVVCELSNEIKISIEGLGEVEARGEASRQEIKIDGGGDVRNFNLSADVTEIDISGLGDVEVSCVESLSVKIDGGGEVCYRGNPTLEDIQIDGIGSVNDCN